MTPTPSLRSIIDGVQRTLRRDASLSLGLLALSVAPAALLLAFALGLLRPWSRPGIGPLLLDTLVLGAAALLVWYGLRRWVRAIDDVAVAEDAERRAGLPAGALRGALELSRRVPDGTSPALARRAEAEAARRFVGLPADQVTGELGRRVRRRRGAATAAFCVLSLGVLTVAFAAPEQSRAAWAPLAQPVANLTHPPLPALRVLPGNTSVTRGSPLEVEVEAHGRPVITLRWRAQGDVPKEDMGVVSAGRAVVVIPRIDAVTEYWIEAPDGAASPRYRVTPIDPLLLSELAVDVVYPRHVGRPAERFTGEVPPLEVPEGTQLVVRGRATRTLQDATLAAGEHGARFQVDGDAFAGTFTPSASGHYLWSLTDRGGETLAVLPAPVELTVLPDGAPLVEIAFPAGDTILDASMRQAIAADARDDYGLTEAAVVSWRIGRDGRRHPEVEERLALNGDDRALIRTVLDAAARELVPGDTLKFFVRVTDNSPRRQEATSRTIALRLPGQAELRDVATDQADALSGQAANLARSAAELQEAMRTMERRTAAANARRRASQQQPGARSGQSGASERMSFQDAAQARQLLERQQDLVQQIEQMRRAIRELERAMERSGLKDAELQERLAELRQDYEEMLSPELKQQMEQLRRALDEMDPEALQKVLEQLTRQQEEMKKQLEASAETMKQAAAEQQMNSLAQEARELATQQAALSDAMREQDRPTPEQAKAQQEMAARAQELAKELADMQQKLEQQGEQAAAEQTKAAGQDARDAGQQMQQAAQDAARQDGQKAADSGQQAAQQLERAADNLDSARQSLADARRQEAQESLQQAMSEALSLAQRQQQLLDQMKQAEAQQGEQGQQGDSVSVQRPPQTPGLPQPPQPQVRIGSEQQRQQGQQQQGQQQDQGQQQGSQQQGRQGGQQQQGQQSGQQHGQQQGQQQGQQGAQQQGGQQQGGQQGQGQQGGQQQGPQGQQGGQQGDGRQGQPGQQGSGTPDVQGMRSEQAALRQGLQQLSRNLQEAAERTGGMNRDVSAALARANLSMEQTLQQLQQGDMPVQQAQQAVESLNRLALSLLTSAQQMETGESGAAGQQATQQQLADLAKKQGSLNGQANSLQPMNLSAGAMSQQLNRLAQDQMEIARRLGNLSEGGQRDGPGADVDAMAREAEELARRMGGGALSPEVLARQERLFHRLLDAGRTLEKDDYDEQRVGDRPGRFDPRTPGALDPRLFDDTTRFRAPTAEELQALPPAYRRMILDYFERLNRAQAQPPAAAAGGSR